MHIVLSLLLWVFYLASFYILVFWFITYLQNRQTIKCENLEEDAHLADYPMISVLIPAYNEQDSVIGSIKSVLELEYPKNKVEVIVINDGSTDDTRPRVEKLISDTKDRNIVLINQSNTGKGAAMNNGLKIVKGKYFACLDADSYVAPQTLKRMVYEFETASNPDLAVVVPAMKIKNPKTVIQRLQWFEYILLLFIIRLMAKLDCIYVAPGPFSLYNTKIIKDIKGFDEGNLTEDQEIAYRLQKNHFKIKHCFNAYVYTSAPNNTKSLYHQRNRWYKGSLMNFLKYRRILWDRSYGDFGMLQMTVNIFVFIFSCASLFFALYFFLHPMYKFIHDMYLVGFDIVPYLKTLNFTFNILYLDIGKILLLDAAFLIIIIFLILSYKNANEKTKKRNFLYLVPYFFFYYLMLSFIAVVALAQLLLGKKQKW